MNRCTNFCRVLPNHSAKAPYLTQFTKFTDEYVMVHNKKCYTYVYEYTKTKKIMDGQTAY